MYKKIPGHLSRNDFFLAFRFIILQYKTYLFLKTLSGTLLPNAYLRIIPESIVSGMSWLFHVPHNTYWFIERILQYIGYLLSRASIKENLTTTLLLTLFTRKKAIVFPIFNHLSLWETRLPKILTIFGYLWSISWLSFAESKDEKHINQILNKYLIHPSLVSYTYFLT